MKLLVVLALVMSASDGAGASRPLTTAAPAGEQQQSTGGGGGGGGLASVKLAVVVRQLWAGPSGCTFDPNTTGPRCP